MNRGCRPVVLGFCLLALGAAFSIRAAEAGDPAPERADRGTPADAIAAASACGEVKERLGSASALRVSARFVDAWNVWVVEFMQGDRRLAFATVNREGNVLEVGRPGAGS